MERFLAQLHFGFDQFLAAPTDQYSVLGWIVLLPLLGAIVNGIWGKQIGRQGVHIAAIGVMVTSFLLSVVAFLALLKSGHAPGEAADAAHAAGEHAEHARRALSFVPRIAGYPWEWFAAPTGPTSTEMIRVRYVLDPLSGVMLLVVTGVGTLIHVYSAGYMSHDKSYARFFAYLNLFVFAMLNLILGDSLPLMFLGWEGVGLASYLLIGFWFENPDYAFAGRKAFIVNRIGDAGLLLGMSILAWKGGSFQFETLRQHVTGSADFFAALTAHTDLGQFLADAIPGVSSINFLAVNLAKINPTWGGLACLFIFIGCCGKSAQLPLFVWLPDAMAGPTPVSALIHAATMVTAGIYLLCRLSFLFVYFTTVMNIIALVGATTALVAASIAVTQTDLKKVLAYSTVSQLGFMFIGCGVGAFSAGFFHVFTHAFFKACMFLGAGAVMHACGDRQDVRKLGGLKKYLPVTFITFAVSTASIIGTPFITAGFYSKDEILWRALTNPFAPTVGKLVYGMGVLAALLTSFYMCRLLFLTFFGDGPKFMEEAAAHGHDDHGHGHDDHGHGHGDGTPSEAGVDMKLMTYTLVPLAALAIVAGFLGLPHAMTHKEGILPAFLEPVVADALAMQSESVIEGARKLEWPAMIGGFLAFAGGLAGAFWVYLAQAGKPASDAAEAVPGVYRFLLEKWRIDELYDAVIVRPLKGAAAFVAGFDKLVIDGLVNGVGAVAMLLGQTVKPFQTGAIQVYGSAIGVGALIMLGSFVLSPRAVVTSRAENGTVAVEVSGGPGYTYRWAFFEPNLNTRSDALSARCVEASATTALAATDVTPTTETRRSTSLTTPRCVVVEATNAFNRTTRAYALLVPPSAR